MRDKRLLYYILPAMLITWMSCRQPYEFPAGANATTNYLVVDGFINAGSDSTIITLSRTRSLSDADHPSPEPGAQVIVEGDGGYRIQLSDLNNGKYGANALQLDNSQKYRINIQTGNGSKYLSDYTPVKSSPAIDSLSWQKSDATGVTVFANTHDPSNNTRFYRWSYIETWEYHASYPTFLRWDPVQSIVFSTTSLTPAACWKSANSTNIPLASSANLAEDVVFLAPITVVVPGSIKLSVKYSILVTQYALTDEAYNYWLNVKKTSEQAGGLFDQEPSQLPGNVHCVTKPGEPVLGYISTGTIAQQRLFISNQEVLPWGYSPSCAEVQVTPDSVAFHATNDLWLPIKAIVGSLNDTVGIVMSSDFCVDCTLRLGTKTGTDVKPPYWP